METTEKIVEAYVRYVRKFFTLPNIKCSGQMELDLLAIDVSDPKSLKRYHIESGVSISGGYSKLTNAPFSPDDLKVRQRISGQRRTLGYFTERKFSAPGVLEKLEEFGFRKTGYQKVIVTWGWEDDVPQAAKRAGVLLWDFREILKEIADSSLKNKSYFTDDTMRTCQLMALAVKAKKK